MTALGMSVKELSAKTGIELQTLYSILNGHHQPSLKKMEAICATLQISLDSLLDLEVNTYFIYPQEYEATHSMASFEDIWFGPAGGERISVSRNLSIANYTMEVKEAVLRKIYKFPEDRIERAMEGFRQRQEVINEKEKQRLEIVNEHEILDFIYQEEPFNQLEQDQVYGVIESVVQRLENNPLDYEVIIVPRQHLLVNYEIINREVLLFDLGSVFLRQTHESILKHFLNEVETFKFKLAKYSAREQVIDFLNTNMARAKSANK